jgi:hypothetical protein
VVRKRPKPDKPSTKKPIEDAVDRAVRKGKLKARREARKGYKNRTGKGDEAVLVIALASGCSIRRASQQSGIKERQIYKRLASPGFNQEIGKVRARMFSRATGLMARYAIGVVSELYKLVRESRDERIKLDACKTILETGRKYKETMELAGRIEELEELIRGDGAAPAAAG